MNAIETIVKYSTQAVDTVFAYESKTALLEGGSKLIDLKFDQAGYVRIMSILMDGLSDYYRVNDGSVANPYSHYQGNGATAGADGYRVGNTKATWEIFKLAYDRGKQFQIDKMDNEETAGLTMAALETEFLRTKVVPEVDSVRFSKIAGYCYKSLGNYVEADPTGNDDATGVIHLFNDAVQWLGNHEVPTDDLIIFVSEEVMTLIRNTKELNKFITQRDFRSERGVDFTLPAYNGMPIIVVPSSRFYTKVNLYDGGYGPGTGSKAINFMIVHRKVAVPVVKLETLKVFGPEVVQNFDGYKMNFRIYHDIFIPKNKVVGAYVCASSSTAASKVANTVSVAAEEGSGSGTTKIVGVYTTPAGMLGDLYYNTSAYTLGAAKSGTLVATDGSDVTFSQANVYFALVANDKVVATSGQITVPQKGE